VLQVEKAALEDSNSKQPEQVHESAPAEEPNTTIQQVANVEAKQQEVKPTADKDVQPVV